MGIGPVPAHVSLSLLSSLYCCVWSGLFILGRSEFLLGGSHVGSLPMGIGWMPPIEASASVLVCRANFFWSTKCLWIRYDASGLWLWAASTLKPVGCSCVAENLLAVVCLAWNLVGPWWCWFQWYGRKPDDLLLGWMFFQPPRIGPGLPALVQVLIFTVASDFHSRADHMIKHPG